MYNCPAVFAARTAAAFGYTIKWVAANAEGTGDGTGSGVGAGAGNSWTLAQAIAGAVAGEMVMVQDDGTYTLAAGITIPAGSATQFCVFAGTGNQNGGDANGGQPEIDANATASPVTLQANSWIENLEIHGSTTDGVATSGSECVMWGCDIHTNGDKGVDPVSSTPMIFFCDIHDNTSHGVDNTTYPQCCFNRVYNNGSMGLKSDVSGVMVHNQCYDNTDDNIDVANRCLVLFNTCDQSDGDASLRCTDMAIVIGNLLTRAPTGQYGLEATVPGLVIDVYNHFHNPVDEPDKDATANTLQAEATTGDPSYADPDNADDDLKDFGITTSSAAATDNLPVPFHDDAKSYLAKGSLEPQCTGGGGVGGDRGAFRGMIHAG